MLQEAIDLQQRAVGAIVQKLGSRNELTFRAPTGSGKTRMMADMMERILTDCPNVRFLVSTLSKGNLAQQNYNVFRDCADSGIFTHLKPYLINTELGSEERLHIPCDHNVYVLPRDLYKKGGILMQGAMKGFLEEMVFKNQHPVYLVKDECHQATNNLDTLGSDYFSKTINFSATPNLRRGQNPDVEISDEEAERACLIKRVEMGDEKDTVEDAVKKFEEIREPYRNLLHVNPCLIIQISNKDKAEQEWAKIKSVLDRHQGLKWMSIMDKDKLCDTNDKVRLLPVRQWKDFARKASSTIDVIVFKMVISEGWDIPRACMLYQVRDTTSRQLDEQVMGRVRRNPRLADFERLSDEAQRLAMTAWVWGIPPDNIRRSHQVRLVRDVLVDVQVKTTHLKPLTVSKPFDIEAMLADKTLLSRESIFELYRRLQHSEKEVRDLCYNYAGGDVQRWLLFCEHLGSVRKEYNSHICNYEESMEVDGTASFPITSVYTDHQNYENIGDWVWRRKDAVDRFSFDSEAEREWASILKDLSREAAAQSGDDVLNDDGRCYLWGKNYLAGSEIRFEYYDSGVHSSYPDFVLKDRSGKIHLFEVKSANKSNSAQFDTAEYKAKVEILKRCYQHCSRLTDQLFYLPVLKDDCWQITRFVNGKEDTISKEQFKRSLSEA